MMEKVSINRNYFLCPYSRTVMKDPVVLVPCGHCMDRDSYLEHARIKKRCVCFECKKEVSEVVPNTLLKTMINSTVVHHLDDDEQEEVEDEDAEFYSTGRPVKKQRSEATMDQVTVSTRLPPSRMIPPHRLFPRTRGGTKLKELRKEFLRDARKSKRQAPFSCKVVSK
jgi:hypothetical protein